MKPLPVLSLALLLLGPTAGPVLPAAVFQHLDLSWAANRGLRDEVEADGKGGWTDQGPDIDLRDLPTGRRDFGGIPFKIIDPGKNQGRSVIVLAGRDRPSFPKEALIDAEGRRGAVLYFLHTCAWGGTSKKTTVAEYEILYQDGEKALVPLRVGIEFTNWWDIRRGDACEVAWSHERRGIRRGINVFAWKNPRPDVPIQSLVFRSRGRMPVPILLAVTLTDEEIPLEGAPEPLVTMMPGDWPVFGGDDPDPTGTAIDMGAVLRDLKPSEERWWGVSLPRAALQEDDKHLSALLRRAAAYGCNLLRIPVEGPGPSEKELESLRRLVDPCRALAVRIFLDPGESSQASDRSLSGVHWPDPSAPEGDFLLESGKFTVGTVDDRAIRESGAFVAEPLPVLMDPSASFLSRLATRRRLGAPFLALYSGAFPNAYGAERPLLAAAFGIFQGWNACVALETIGPEWGTQVPDDLGTQPAWMIPFPVAALAFRRGDLKETSQVLALPKGAIGGLPVLARRSGWRPGKGDGAPRKDAAPSIQERTQKVTSDSGQIVWQGNIGVAQVNAPRFQVVMGFVAHRRFKNAVWDVESPNEFVALSAISLTKEGIQRSKRVLLSASARAINSGMAFSPDRKRCLSLGHTPVHLEPVRATVVLHRMRPEPGLKVQALDTSGRPLKKQPRIRWLNNDVYLTWVPEAAYLLVAVP